MRRNHMVLEINGLCSSSSRVYVYVSKQSQTIPVHIDLFTATCFGFNCEPSWGLL